MGGVQNLTRWVVAMVVLGGAVAALLCRDAPACAQINDRVSFEIPGVVIVWAAGTDPTRQAPIVSDFIVRPSGGPTRGTDLIAASGQAVVTGTLESVFVAQRDQRLRIERVGGGGGINIDSNRNGLTDPDDRISPFQLRANGRTGVDTRRTEFDSSFYIASNTAFAIDATAAPIGTTATTDLDEITLQLRVTRTDAADVTPFGSSARFPHTGNRRRAGTNADFRALSTLAGDPNVFSGNRSTAATDGSIIDQSVRFDARYRYRSPEYDLTLGPTDVSVDVVYTIYVL